MKHNPIIKTAMEERIESFGKIPDLTKIEDEGLRVFDLSYHIADVSEENLGVSFLLIKEGM